MRRNVQGTNDVVIDAEPEAIWQVLEDPLRVPEYMHSVKRVRVPEGEREHVGAIRTCDVEMEGRQGEVVERCIELVPNRRLSHVIERDAFGFSRFFDDFGFTWILEPTANERTLVRIEGFYRERNSLSKLMNRLVMRRKLDALRRGILADLKSVVENAGDRDRSPTPLS